ncbi:MAG: hypothetical protein JO112_12485, partial [Planctomycetes bacterium]|nr:hypothetical protein [Planctomycetota bacterium]
MSQGPLGAGKNFAPVVVNFTTNPAGPVVRPLQNQEVNPAWRTAPPPSPSSSPRLAFPHYPTILTPVKVTANYPRQN